MSPALPSERSPLPDWRACEELLRRFDQAWQNGKPPRIEEFAPATAPARRELLEELLRIDLEYRWRLSEPGPLGPGLGLPPRLEDYLARFPELGPAESLSLDLIGYEYRVRQHWGDRPGLDEYGRRFPRHGPALHQALRRIDAELAAEFGRIQARPGAAPPLGEPVVAVAGLLEVLRRTELLSPPRWEELSRLDPKTRFANARDLARELMRRDWLTPYQVNQLLQGRGDDLVLGSYVLLERLGEGGAGQVFKARHRKMDRVVALKVIRKELLVNPEMVGRFYREMHLLGGLSHANIVHALDSGPVGSVHLLAMEYVEGTDLLKLVRDKGPLSVPLACEYARQVALGLQYVHEKGLVHRDIKPNNLLLSKPGPQGAGLGQVKILDLGLARLQQRPDGDMTSLITPTGGMMGTPDFLAPEQALDFHQADIRADIYSLGCTLYYLLTGQPPFPGGTLAQKVARHMQTELPPITELRRDVPSALVEVLRRMTAKQPAERYQTPVEVALALGPFARGGDTSKIRVRIPLRARISRRTFWRAGAAAALLLGGFVLFRGWRRGPPGQIESPPVAIPPEERFAGQPPELVAVLGTRRFHPWGDVRGIAFSADGSLIATAAAMHEDIILWDRKTGWEKTVLRLKEKGSFTKIALTADGKTLVSLRALRGQVILWDIPSGKVRQAIPDERISAIALSPDGKILATGVPNRGLKLWQTETGTLMTSFPGDGGSFYGLAFAPDGKWLAGVRSGDRFVKLWEVATGKERTLSTGSHQPTCVTFSPDGKTLAVAGMWLKHELMLWDMETEKLRTVKVGPETIYALAFAPDSRTIAIKSTFEAVHLWDVTPGKERELKRCGGPTQQTHNQDIASPLAFAPDGKAVAWGAPGAVVLWDMTAEKEQTFGTAHTRSAVAVAFAPDGQTLASAGRDGRIILWDPAAARQLKVLQGAPGEMHSLAFAPDGKLLAGAGWNSNGVVLWDPDSGKQRRLLRGLQWSAEVIAFTNDGSLVAAGTELGQVGVWETATGRSVGTVMKHSGGAVQALAFSPDGQFLVSGGLGIKLWETRTSKELGTFPEPDLRTCSLLFAPDGKTLLSIGHDEVIRQWDVASRQEVRASAKAQLGGLTCAAFSASGETVVEGHEAGVLLSRKAETGEEISRTALPGPIRDVAIAPDGRHVATANENSTVYVLRLRTVPTR
jgi:serine/threonine protein kinase/WD40 repeat protein